VQQKSERNSNLANRLKSARDAAGLTQAALGESWGKASNYIWMLESGAKPFPEKLEPLLQELERKVRERRLGSGGATIEELLMDLNEMRARLDAMENRLQNLAETMSDRPKYPEDRPRNYLLNEQAPSSEVERALDKTVDVSREMLAEHAKKESSPLSAAHETSVHKSGPDRGKHVHRVDRRSAPGGAPASRAGTDAGHKK
jgi:transcriptional regulator with XRE-family HTH domain